jgi:peptidoglycan hydrolase-like protein with peptidoglycan-binding domain
MKRALILPALLSLLALLAMTPLAHADDQTQKVQQALKDQGFYYGQVDGQPGPETDAAIKRYQIRQGLEVTGKLNAQTLQSLNGGGDSGGGNSGGGDSNTLQSVPAQPDNSAQQDNSAPAQAPQDDSAQQPPAQAAPSVVQSDHDFLKNKGSGDSAQAPDVDQAPRAEAVPPQPDDQAPPPSDQPVAPQAVPPPGAVVEGQTLPRDYSYFFRKTPYETAPPVVQRSTVHQAQVQLGRHGFYRGVADGELSKGFSHAISGYQHYADLKDTGRLDADTLADMNLMPRRHAPIPPGPVYVPQQVPPPPPYGEPNGVYRGVWVH